jgi:hypothetical protein
MKHTQTQEQKILAEEMRLALEKEHSFKMVEPHIVSQYRKETLRLPFESNIP